MPLRSIREIEDECAEIRFLNPSHSCSPECRTAIYYRDRLWDKIADDFIWSNLEDRICLGGMVWVDETDS